jgi:hypothetical protein
MISGWFLSPTRPKNSLPMVLGTPYNDDWKYNNAASKLKISSTEARRRDEIIRTAWLQCRLHKGMFVTLSHPEKEKVKYTNAKVLGVCKNIDEYGDTGWPKNDNPFIVSVTTDQGEVSCTNGYFIPTTEVVGGSC